MNRLTALEANQTLYTRYVEEQTNGIREMLRRLGEDVGRLEGIGKAQNQRFQRTINEWETQRDRLEMDYRELMSRVDYLSDEIVLEKRLGIAQLCLLMAVLVFMGLTRGSRGEPLMEHAPVIFNKSMREWSRRHLSFSGDWVSRLTNKSRSSSPAEQKTSAKETDINAKYEFPSSAKTPRTAHKAPYYPTRPRTPSLRTPTSKHFHSRAIPVSPSPIVTSIPNGIHRPPRLKRANSHGGGSTPASATWTGIGPVPKSAKRLARTAHLHEVKSVKSPTVKMEEGDLNQSPSLPPHHQHAQSLPTLEMFSTPSRQNGTEFDAFLDQMNSSSPGKDPTSVLFSQSPGSPEADTDAWSDTEGSVCSLGDTDLLL